MRPFNKRGISKKVSKVGAIDLERLDFAIARIFWSLAQFAYARSFFACEDFLRH
jgi:hypothetical protein